MKQNRYKNINNILIKIYNIISMMSMIISMMMMIVIILIKNKGTERAIMY